MLEELSLNEENCYYHQGDLYVLGEFGQKALNSIKSETIHTIFLFSPGGSTSTALSAAKLIRDKEIQTAVLKDGQCNSSCTLVFQAGTRRIAHPTAKFMYHCVGSRFLYLIFSQNCGEDLNSLSTQCQKDLEELQESATIGSERHFQHYKQFDGQGLWEMLMNSSDDSDWFESGNFCRKKVILTAEETMDYNVVQELMP